MARGFCLAAGLLFALSSASLLSGCAGFGNDSIADASPKRLSAQLVKGKTREEHVRKIYGEPAKVSLADGGMEIWEYDYSRLLASRTTDSFPYLSVDGGPDKKELKIFFNKDKVVQKYTLNTTPFDFTAGLVMQ